MELEHIDELVVEESFFWLLSQNVVVKHGVGGNLSLGALKL